MGTILGSKVREDGKIVFEVCVDKKEAIQLGGKIDDIYLLALDKNAEETSVVQRGKNEATMYFLIPKDARQGLKKTETATFQKLTLSRKKAYFYVVNNE